ncbi:MAG: hypothetical protein Q9157_002735 [Trypethelium eluteriae]
MIHKWLSAAGITPSSSKTYTTAAIQSALSSNHGGHDVYLGCSNGALNQVYYYFNVKGSVQNGTFQASDPDGGDTSSCPSTGVKYLPKSGASTTISTGTATGTSSSTRTSSTSNGSAPTATSFSGQGYLNVQSGGDQNGCIISAGKWYTTGTCATFTAVASGHGFTLKSSKGSCGISNNALTCGSGVTATVFTSSGGMLAVSGSTSFYADSAPTGSAQATVYTTSDDTALTISWEMYYFSGE